MTGYIFGGADIADYSSISIPEGALVIAADSGYRHCLRLGISPDRLVGDFDSIECSLPESSSIELITAPAEKDDTDLLMAVRECLTDHCTAIRIYGGDGGRMGHTLANIQTLRFIARSGCDGRLIGNDFELVYICSGKRHFSDRGFRYVSIFSMTEKSEIKVTGLKYSGEDGLISLSGDYPKGVSNEFTGSECTVEVTEGEVLTVLEY